VISIMIETGKRLSELADQMTEYPQLLVNVAVASRDGWEGRPAIRAAIEDAERTLDGRGRIVVRASGTEKLIRVMAEGPDMDEIRSVVDRVAEAVARSMGSTA
jgi:phosphoglucosamine mutase